jgi:hypothetical protein
VDKLTEQMGRMTIHMNHMNALAGQGFLNQFNKPSIAPNTYDRGNFRCYYCFDPDHIKPSYPKFEQDKMADRCHVRDDNRIYISRFGKNGERF